ncbi:MAG: ATP-binding protein [Thiohalobacteraceae bacterium]
MLSDLRKFLLPAAVGSLPTVGMLRRLSLLRNFALIAQSVTVLATHYALEIRLPLGPMFAVISALGLFNLAAWVRLERPWPVTRLEFLGHLLVDVVALTLLLYLSGGSTNPFVSLFLLPITIAAISLSSAHAWFMTLFSIGCYSLLMFWFVPLEIPHTHDSAFNLHVVGMWFNFIASALLIAFFIERMAASLRQRDRDLARAREDSLRNEQIIALGSLAAGAAHELGTPLATMAVVTNELQQEYQGDTELAPSLDVLRDQVTVCKTILTRIAASAGTIRPEEARAMPLDDYLNAVVERWRLMRPGVWVNARWQNPLPPPQVMDEQALSQALLNLFNNAADASPEEIDIVARWDEELLQLDILDRGPGIDHDTARKAGQVAVQSTKREPGLGLGLLISNATIERLGGHVSMRQRPGGGTCVQVELPLAAIATGAP